MSAKSLKGNIPVYLAVFALLLVFAAVAVSIASPKVKSATCDELAHHIPVGFVLLTKGDFGMDPSQPPLPRYLAALPLKLFMDLKMPADKNEWRREDRSTFGKDFFYKYNSDPDAILFASRLAIVAVGILCGIILFVWAKALYGAMAALLSLFLYSLCPNILSNTSLATTDMTAACSMLLAIAAFWYYVSRPTIGMMCLAGIALGLAELSKYTNLLLYPLFLLLLLFELPSAKAGHERKIIILRFLGIILISVLVVWAGYGFEVSPILKDAMRVDEKLAMIHKIAGTRLDNFLLNTPVPLGAHIIGILGVIRHGQEGHSTFFCGTWSGHGNPLYFALAFLIKTPIPAIIFIFTGLIMSLRRIGRNERFLIISIAFFFITASLSKLQLGLRHILPIYPLCFILAGKTVDLFGKKIVRALAVLFMAWYLVIAVHVWPDYLSYFNEFVGGPGNGYKYLRDSNIDWGQDLPALANYLKKNGIDKVRLLYFGTADPARYGITYTPISPAEMDVLSPGVYAISVHKIDTVKWAKEREPAAKIGFSIYVYDLREKEVN